MCLFLLFWGRSFQQLNFEWYRQKILAWKWKENSQIFNEDFYLPLYLPLWCCHSAVSIGNNILPNGIKVVQYIFGIWDWGLPNSFWEHVIQISIRLMNFQYIFSQLWKVKIFCRNIYSLWPNTYFRRTVMYVQYGYLFLILTRPKLTELTQVDIPCRLKGIFSS